MSNRNCCKIKKDDTIIEALQSVMKEYGYVSRESVKKIAKSLNKSESEIYGVLTFYSQFKTEEVAKYEVCVCTGTACFILGSETVLERICNILHVEPNKISSDKKWIVTTVRCLGCCGLSPVMTINGKVYGNLKVDTLETILKEYN